MLAPTPLLSTIRYILPTRPILVPRPRLIARLNEGAIRSLTLISAPAEFGKTTLASERRVLAAGRGCPLAWPSLKCDS